MMNKTLSIIIPTFNASSLLAATLDSISQQTFKYLEVIIIDGGSEDIIIDIVNKYRAKGLSIIFKSEPDEGVYDAMNKGIMLSSGNWLYFLGAGDTFSSPETLSSISKGFEMDIDIIQGIVRMTSNNKLYIDRLSSIVLLTRNFCHQGLFYRKWVFNEVGFYEKKYLVCADADHNYRWFFNPKIKRKYIPICICNFLGGGLSAGGPDQAFKNDKDFLIQKAILDHKTFSNYSKFLFYRLFCLLPKGLQIRIKKHILRVT